MKTQKLSKQIIIGWGYLIFAEILSLLIVMFTGNFFTNIVLRFIIALCPLTMLIGLMCNYSHNIAKRDIIEERNISSKKHWQFKPLLLGITTATPLFILWIILLLSKLNMISIDFLVTYKLLNSFFLPVIDFIHHGTEIKEVSIISLIIILLLNIIPIIAVYVSYNVTYQNKDDKDFTKSKK